MNKPEREYSTVPIVHDYYNADDMDAYLASLNTWISVDDRLPEDARPVIVAGGCGHYSRKYKRWFSNMERNKFGEYLEIQWNVTHWMPIPELPDGE